MVMVMGMQIAALALSQADGFAVTSLDDVHLLRRCGIDKPLTMLSAVLDENELATLNELNVRPTIFDESQITAFEHAKPSQPLSVWLKVDTGMGRLGITPDKIPEVIDRLRQFPSIADISLMTHLANADEPGNPLNAAQLRLFEKLAGQAEYTQLSVLNSAGTISFSGSAKDVVRPGLMLYGASPLPGISAQELNLRPVMTFISKLISVKKLPKGSSVGYGSTYKLERDSLIGIVACGYGDGYPRHAPTGTPVVVNGVKVSLVGRVSMDMLAVDLSRVGAEVGDDAILWGEGNPIEDIARAATTIAYELTCGITSRVERILI